MPARGRARLWVRHPVGWPANWLPTIAVWLINGVLPLPDVAGWEWLKRHRMSPSRQATAPVVGASASRWALVAEGLREVADGIVVGNAVFSL